MKHVFSIKKKLESCDQKFNEKFQKLTNDRYRNGACNKNRMLPLSISIISYFSLAWFFSFLATFAFIRAWFAFLSIGAIVPFCIHIVRSWTIYVFSSLIFFSKLQEIVRKSFRWFWLHEVNCYIICVPSNDQQAVTKQDLFRKNKKMTERKLRNMLKQVNAVSCRSSCIRFPCDAKEKFVCRVVNAHVPHARDC